MNKLVRLGFSGLLLGTILNLAGGFSQPLMAQIPTDSLQLHLNASLGVSITSDSVNTWADQSGNGNDAFQNTLGRRPILVSNSMNGEPVIRFNGVDSYLTLPTAADLGIQNSDYEIFIVSRSATINTNIEFLLAGNAERYELHLNGSAGARFIPKASTYIDEGSIGDYSDTNAHIYNLRATDTYGNITVDAENSTNYAGNVRNSDAGNIYLGVRFDNSFTLNGDIAEVIIYNSVLSESDRETVENYLKVKYHIGQNIAETPTVQASNLTASNLTNTSVELDLTAGNGEKRMILAKSGTAVDFEPVDGISYTANASFGSSAELGTGNYAVYAGTDTTVTVTGLSADKAYHFYAVEYNGAEGEEAYLRTNPARNQVITPAIPSTNLKLHLRADAGVNVSGTEVTGWTDQSGNGNDATQTSASNRPVLVANSMNGKPGLRFNGTNNFLSLPTTTDLGIVNNDYQIFIIAKTSSVTNNVYFLTSAQSATEEYEMHTNGSNGVRFIPKAGVYIDEGSTGEYTDAKPHLFQMEATSTYGLVRMDGKGIAQSNGDRRSSNASNLLLGTRNGGVLWFNGDIAEVIVYNDVLSESERQSVENYLKVKYNIDQPVVEPTVQASNLTVSEITNNSMKISLTPGNGENRIIVASKSSDFFSPADTVSYTANSQFGLGDDVGNNGYVVYNGAGNEVTVTGLGQDSTYYFTAYEYNGENSSIDYLLDAAEDINARTNFSPISVQSQSVVERTASSATFTAVVNRSLSLSTSYRVLWGTDSSSLTDSSSTIIQAAGSSTDTISYEITGLSANTLYFARIRAITSQENVLSDPVPIFFNNTTIPGDSLTLWLNADMSLSGVANGESVSLWYDLSGKSNNGSQDNSSYKPVMATNQINGLPAVSFVGNSYFSLPNAQELGVVNKDYEIIVVASSASSQRSLLFGNNYTSQFAPNMWLNYDQGFLFNGNGNHGYDFTVGEFGEYTNGEYHVFNVIGMDTEGRIRIDNVQEGLDTSESYRNNVNGNWKIGASINPANGVVLDDFDGEVAEIIVYNKELSNQERFDIHEYLSEKYNLDLPLGTPDQQVSNIQFETSGATSATLNYTPGNGAYNLAVIKAGSPVDATPTDSITYTASSVFGSGSEIGTGNFVVYAGLDSTIAISGLTQGTTYHAAVYSFNGDPAFENYLTSNADTASLFVPITISVTQLSPTPFSLKNAEDTVIKITFDKAMNPLSFGTDSSFIVNGSEGGVYTGTFQFSDGNKIAEFTADSAFKAGETITVNITKKLEGAANPFKDPRTFSFHIETAISSATFEKTSALGQGFYALRTHISDLNGDGKGDIYMVDSSGELHVRINNGNGSYNSKIEYSTDAEDPSFVAVDIDGDGDLDIIVSNDDGSDIFILKNNGDGTFASATNINYGSPSYSIGATDLDHDGNPDLILGTDSILVSLNTDGLGLFSSYTSYLPGSSSYDIVDIAVSDMDADGDVDIIALDNNNGFYLFKNNGDGTLQEAILLGQADEPSSVSIGDLDNDGDADFVVSSIDYYRIYVYKNNGDATFAASAQYETDDLMKHTTLSDIDGDGDLDLIGEAESDYYIHLFLNSGNGAYPSYSSLNINSYVSSFSLSDFDNDNDVDLFVATYDSLHIYENISFDPLTINGSEGWRLLASPVGDIEYGTFLSSLWTQGATGADTESGTPNVYQWPITSTSASDTNWTAVTSMSDTLQSTRGMLVYVFSDDNGPAEGNAGFPKEIAVPGFEPTSTQFLSYNLLNSNTNGWTLLGNPFYRTIDWDDITRDELSSSVYVYDDTAAVWKSWNGSSGSLSGGEIKPFNAFFVQSFGDDPYISIPYPSSEEGEGFDALAKAVSEVKVDFFSLQLSSSSGLNKEAWFQFTEEGSEGIDSYDAHLLKPFSSDYVLFGSKIEDGDLLDINNLPIPESELEIPLYFESTVSGNHEISFDPHLLPEGWIIELKDHETGKVISLNQSYKFSYQAPHKKRSKITPASLINPVVKAKSTEQMHRFTLIVKPALTTNGEQGAGVPDEFALIQNYPNPFNPSTQIDYQLPVDARVNLTVYDMLGRQVAVLVNEQMRAGYYSITFNARNLASGMYIYRLKAGSTVINKKLTLIK